MSISKKLFGLVFKEEKKQVKNDNVKPLVKEISFILPYPKKNNTQTFSRMSISDYKPNKNTSIFEGIEGLNVKERKFYN